MGRNDYEYGFGSSPLEDVALIFTEDEQILERNSETWIDPADYGREQVAQTIAERASAAKELGLPDLKKLDDLNQEAWLRKAACKGVMGLFFPPNSHERGKERDEREEQAKAICRQCGVIDKCLEFAVVNISITGIWGGTNEKERRDIRRKRRKAA